MLLSQGFSMYPLLIPNDLITFNKKSKYKQDDIIVFIYLNKYITHRLVYLNSNYFYSKGDNQRILDKKNLKKNILGKVDYIYRNKKKLSLNKIYLNYFLIYFFELSKITNFFNKNKINHVYIKGPLNFYFYTNKIPNYFYKDCDILVDKLQKKIITKILLNLGFNEIIKSNFQTQTNFTKTCKGVILNIDIHFEPAIYFTRFNFLNNYFINKQSLNKLTINFLESKKIYKKNNIKFPILNPESQLTYTYMHFFHHNFKGIEKLRLTQKIFNLIDTKKFILFVKKNNIENIIKKSIEIDYALNKNKKIKEIFKKIFKTFPKKVKIKNLLQERNNYFSAIERFFNVFYFSNENYLKKTLVFFDYRVYKEFFKISFYLFLRFLKTAFFLKKKKVLY